MHISNMLIDEYKQKRENITFSLNAVYSFVLSPNSASTSWAKRERDMSNPTSEKNFTPKSRGIIFSALLFIS